MKKETILLFALAAAALSSCSSEENMPNEDGNAKVAFSATINGTPAGRAFDQTWESGDHIGISCVSGDKTYTNVDYQYTGNGNFSVATPGQEIYYQNYNVVTFTAYYPWNNLNGATAILADTRVQSQQKTFDFLHATATGKRTQPNVSLAFSHKMTKLVLTVKKGSDISFNEVKEAVLTLDGFKYDGTFDVVTGNTTVGTGIANCGFAGNADAKYNAPKVENADESVTYTLIFFPQSFTNKLPLTATISSGLKFSADLDFTAANTDTGKNEWLPGRQYNMSVTLHKTALTVNGCTIQAWDDKDAGNVDAK